MVRVISGLGRSVGGKVCTSPTRLAQDSWMLRGKGDIRARKICRGKGVYITYKVGPGFLDASW